MMGLNMDIYFKLKVYFCCYRFASVLIQDGSPNFNSDADISICNHLKSFNCLDSVCENKSFIYQPSTKIYKGKWTAEISKGLSNIN